MIYCPLCKEKTIKMPKRKLKHDYPVELEQYYDFGYVRPFRVSCTNCSGSFKMFFNLEVLNFKLIRRSYNRKLGRLAPENKSISIRRQSSNNQTVAKS